ncbi:histone-binding protein N1/N2-like [Bacillus rossius redtenbacheri]|uniref:histone-binding protein N1/N2-like n=1 Tax=Bacillus rossius redtenbacheri TaxID=93214 RepID=UPI002FDC8BDF
MESQTSACNPVSGTEEIDLKQKAYTHLAQGKRHLLVKDYYEAANSLADACTYFDTLYGTGANECGEVYFNYGKALLELGRSESNVLGLGDNPDGKDDESENSSDEDANENGEDETPENVGDVKSEKVDEPGKGSEPESVSDGKGDTEAADSTMNVSESPEGDGEKEDDGDDNLKLAWEVLELAKTIFERQSKTEKHFELKLAEVYFKLCEVGLESGVYDQAIEDMKICVGIQKANLSDDDRILAESFYELGIAYSLKNDYDEAISEFENAIKVLEKRIGSLQEMLKVGVPKEVKESDPFYSIEGEIKELNELIPEIRDKISDLQDAKKETVNYIRDQLVKEQILSGGETACSSSSAPAPPPNALLDVKPAAVLDTKPAAVSDISHLVRKRPK